MVWEIKVLPDKIIFGCRTIKVFNRDYCNIPFKNYYYCPKLKWFMKDKCIFTNKSECDSFERFCGHV